MSDVSQGQGWWQASDDKWYPPQGTPHPQPATPRSAQSAPGPGGGQASDGKWYPPEARPGSATSLAAQPGPGQAPAPKKRGQGCLYGVLGVLALIVIIGIIAALGGSKSKNASPTTTPNNATAPSATTGSSAVPYKFGETAQTGGLDVTVYDAKDPQPPTNQFSTP